MAQRSGETDLSSVCLSCSFHYPWREQCSPERRSPRNPLLQVSPPPNSAPGSGFDGHDGLLPKKGKEGSTRETLLCCHARAPVRRAYGSGHGQQSCSLVCPQQPRPELREGHRRRQGPRDPALAQMRAYALSTYVSISFSRAWRLAKRMVPDET